MLKLYLKIFLIIICFSSKAQTDDKKGTGPKDKTFKEQLKAEKFNRKQAREQRRKERAEKKAVRKYQKRLQTKSVLKRMKQSKKKSERYNQNKREPFFIRLFNKKKKA
ncbi:MAG: hypothetical protein JSU07_02665 [Bacteroidetes bacterium]|nr:hypothetical protein [Bacteroidota bacterium]